MQKRDFGSFHASNVDELVTLTNLKEEAKLPVPEPLFDEYSDGKFEFGKSARKNHFFLEEESIFINHGAFGSVLKEGLEVAQKWQIYAEKQPLRFIDREILPLIVRVTRQLSAFVGADTRNIVMVQNVTTALNCILKSYKFEQGDVIFTFSTIYGATKKILKEVCLKSGTEVYEAEVTFPIMSEQQVVDLVRNELKPGMKLAMLDHIPSNAPIVLPLKEIIHICHERGVAVLIDGAHAPGSLNLDLVTLDADFYVANCHKWLCAPKGVAFMYINPKFHQDIHPVITSHGQGSGLHGRFSWQGLRDYSGWLALPTVLNFWKSVGPQRIRDYNHALAMKVAGHLTSIWKSKTMAPLNMFASMILVQLPSELWENLSKVTYSDAEVIQNLLYHNYNIEVPVKVVGNSLCVRVSIHIYNTMEDYKKLGDAILEIAWNNQSSDEA